MKLQSYQLFSQLCESIVEASTTGSLINNLPGGRQVLKYLHSQQGLGHEQAYKPIATIAWSDLKNAYRGAWVIMQYAKGVGAIKQLNGTYYAAASTGAEVKEFNDTRGGNVLDFLKRELGGKPVKMWAGTETGKTKDIKSKRKQSQQDLAKVTTMTPDALVKKFSPLWSKAMTAAVADIKGMVGNMIKNDAFDKAERKIAQLQRLDKALLSLETEGADRPDFLNSAINQAIHMAAAHYYPDETGEITRRYSGYDAQRPEGVQHLLADISGGDQKKLGAVLSFFKRALITG